MSNSDPEREALELERFLPFRLSVLGTRVSRVVARAYGRRFQISVPEWRAMAALGSYGAMTAQEVGKRTTMDKVRVSRALKRLAARQWITRRPALHDGRRSIIDLAPAGHAIYTQVAPLVLAIEAQLVANLTETERTALETVLGKLEASVRGLRGTDAEV